MDLSLEISNDIGLQLIPRKVAAQRHSPTSSKGKKPRDITTWGLRVLKFCHWSSTTWMNHMWFKEKIRIENPTHSFVCKEAYSNLIF